MEKNEWIFKLGRRHRKGHVTSIFIGLSVLLYSWIKFHFSFLFIIITCVCCISIIGGLILLIKGEFLVINFKGIKYGKTGIEWSNIQSIVLKDIDQFCIKTRIEGYDKDYTANVNFEDLEDIIDLIKEFRSEIKIKGYSEL